MVDSFIALDYCVVLWSGYYLDQNGYITPDSQSAGQFSRRTAYRLAEGVGDVVLSIDIAQTVLVDDNVTLFV